MTRPRGRFTRRRATIHDDEATRFRHSTAQPTARRRPGKSIKHRHPFFIYAMISINTRVRDRTFLIWSREHQFTSTPSLPLLSRRPDPMQATKSKMPCKYACSLWHSRAMKNGENYIQANGMDVASGANLPTSSPPRRLRSFSWAAPRTRVYLLLSGDSS